MPEDAGKLEVKYVVISAAALRRLERLEKQFDKVGDAAEKQAKKTRKTFKQAGKAVAAFGAVIVGVLYGIIRSSSYASLWMDQLRYTTMRLADKLLELTGLKDDIDDFFSSLDDLVDKLETAEDLEDIIISVAIKTGEFIKWFSELSLVKKIIYTIIAAIGFLTAAWAAVVGYGLAAAGWIKGMAAIKVSLAGIAAAGGAVIAFLATLPMWVVIAIGAIIGLIAVWILWKTGVLEAIYDLGGRFGTWLAKWGERFGVWVAEMGARFGVWISGMKEAIDGWVMDAIGAFETFKTALSTIFDNIWTRIIEGLKTMKTEFFGIITGLINKVSALITKILSIPSPSFGGGFGGGGGSFGTSISSGSMPGGGDSSATGGHVLRSGAQMVHQGEDIINLTRVMNGVRAGDSESDRSITVHNTINITGGNLSNTFEANRVATALSKRMGDELRRISTSI